MKVFQLEQAWSVDHLKLTDKPKPEPGPGQVLLKMKAASLNYRDLVVLERGYGRLTGELPLVPLSDGVGTVEAMGEQVTRVRIGQRVTGLFAQTWQSGAPSKSRLRETLGGPLSGMMAEYVVLDQEGVAPVPDHLSDSEAATLPCAALTAWSALHEHGRIQPGDRVLIQGTGGVALFALQFARLAGAEVILTSSSDDKLARAISLGADHGINYRSTPEWGKAVLALTNQEGVDHIVEVGGTKTLPESLRCIRPGGTISMIGVLSGGELQARLGMIVTRQVRLQGITVGHRDGFNTMCRAINLHRLKPVVDRIFPFEALPEALAYLRSGNHFGKICIHHPA